MSKSLEGRNAMSNPPQRKPAIRHRFATCLALASALGLAGCRQPGEGTVQVSPEARARLLPRVPVTTRGPKGQGVEQRPIGIKDRRISRASTP
jgi:hypothetical protein